MFKKRRLVLVVIHLAIFAGWLWSVAPSVNRAEIPPQMHDTLKNRSAVNIFAHHASGSGINTGDVRVLITGYAHSPRHRLRYRNPICVQLLWQPQPNQTMYAPAIAMQTSDDQWTYRLPVTADEWRDFACPGRFDGQDAVLLNSRNARRYDLYATLWLIVKGLFGLVQSATVG